MFSRQSGLNASGTTGSNLVEFRAGRMTQVGKMVHPDDRKGLVYMFQSEDGLMHFCWKDRSTGKVEDDLIVFPDDFEYKRVDQCKTGRVYVLKFKTSSRRMFFWMQEPKADKDEEYCRRVNELLNNPPTVTRSTQEGGDLQYMLNNMSQQQLMQLFGGVGQMSGLSSLLGSINRSSDTSRTSTRNNFPLTGVPGTPVNNTALSREVSTNKIKSADGSGTGSGSDGNNTEVCATPATTVTPTDTGNETGGKKSYNMLTSVNAFQSYLSNLSPEAGSGRSLNIDLSTALASSDAVTDLISDPERVNMLSVHLPETEDLDENRKQQIKDTIASPQFQQALSLFSNALQSAQLGPVVSQFELTPDAVTAAYAGNLEEFVKALEKALPAGATMPSPNADRDSKEVTEKTKQDDSEKQQQNEQPNNDKIN